MAKKLTSGRRSLTFSITVDCSWRSDRAFQISMRSSRSRILILIPPTSSPTNRASSLLYTYTNLSPGELITLKAYLKMFLTQDYWKLPLIYNFSSKLLWGIFNYKYFNGNVDIWIFINDRKIICFMNITCGKTAKSLANVHDG